MRKYVFMLCACVVLCFVIGMHPVSSQASETAADELSNLFYQYVYGGEVGHEGRVYKLGKQFFKDPAAFVRQLSLETEDIQKAVIHNFPRQMYNGMHPRGYSEFPSEIFSINLTDEDTVETRNIVNALENEIANYWGISNPHTRDSIGFAALLMAVSGLGIAVLLKRRKLLV